MNDKTAFSIVIFFFSLTLINIVLFILLESYLTEPQSMIEKQFIYMCQIYTQNFPSYSIETCENILKQAQKKVDLSIISRLIIHLAFIAWTSLALFTLVAFESEEVGSTSLRVKTITNHFVDEVFEVEKVDDDEQMHEIKQERKDQEGGAGTPNSIFEDEQNSSGTEKVKADASDDSDFVLLA